MILHSESPKLHFAKAWSQVKLAFVWESVLWLPPRYLSSRDNKWSARFWEKFTQLFWCFEIFCMKHKQTVSIAEMELFTAISIFPQLIPYSWSDGGGWRKCGLSPDRLIPDYRTQPLQCDLQPEESVKAFWEDTTQIAFILYRTSLAMAGD